VVPSGPVGTLPLVAKDPVQFPEAVHDVALLLLQVSVAPPPLLTLVGLADSVTVGAGEAVPVVVAVDGAAECEPPDEQAARPIPASISPPES
jgi:hypothetical protein